MDLCDWDIWTWDARQSAYVLVGTFPARSAVEATLDAIAAGHDHPLFVDSEQVDDLLSEELSHGR